MRIIKILQSLLLVIRYNNKIRLSHQAPVICLPTGIKNDRVSEITKTLKQKVKKILYMCLYPLLCFPLNFILVLI